MCLGKLFQFTQTYKKVFLSVFNVKKQDVDCSMRNETENIILLSMFGTPRNVQIIFRHQYNKSDLKSRQVWSSDNSK